MCSSTLSHSLAFNPSISLCLYPLFFWFSFHFFFLGYVSLLPFLGLVFERFCYSLYNSLVIELVIENYVLYFKHLSTVWESHLGILCIGSWLDLCCCFTLCLAFVINFSFLFFMWPYNYKLVLC
jgi:hypothetical protein